jgi:hypothetical protein
MDKQRYMLSVTLGFFLGVFTGSLPNLPWYAYALATLIICMIANHCEQTRSKKINVQNAALIAETIKMIDAAAEEVEKALKLPAFANKDLTKIINNKTVKKNADESKYISKTH